MYSSSSCTPRSILKNHVSSSRVSTVHRSPDTLHAVHFPPSPTLTRVYTAHSPAAYDRSPIVVLPNACALPERGCPGRTYTLDGECPKRPSSSKKRSSNGSHTHPRAASHHSSVFPARSGEDDHKRPFVHDPSLVPPPLIPDLSSESDESDGFTSLPGSVETSLTPGPSIPKPRIRMDHMSPITPYRSEEQGHPGAPPFQPYQCPSEDPHKAPRRPQRDHSRERLRKWEYASDEASRDGGYRPFSLRRGCALDTSDDGCLGGF
ncbi:hypothetical protein ID866_4301 [Astraeus odoratus]|nr:hypothetical protein ID866_4301 [Astraeus odoratus]